MIMDKSYKEWVLENKETDFRYRQQIDETNHQNHRMVWILAAQTLIFAALPLKYLNPDSAKEITPCLLGIIVMVGCCISVSSVYSMMVGEFAIGYILDGWQEHKKKGKLKDLQHFVIAVPPPVLESKLSFLSLYSFAPKVFSAAWATILFVFLNCYHIFDIGIMTIGRTILCFFVVLVGVMLMCYLYYAHKKEQISNDRLKTTIFEMETDIDNFKKT